MKFLWKIASVAGVALATYVVVISVYLVVSIAVFFYHRCSNKQEVPQPSRVPVAEEELKVFVQPWVLRANHQQLYEEA